MAKLIIGIDVTDWRDECMREEVTLLTEDDLVALVTELGYTTGEAARFGVVQEEMSIMPEGIMKPRKLQLYAGARQNITTMIASRKTEIEAPNGKMFEARTWLGIPRRKADDDGNGAELSREAIEAMGERSFVVFDSQAALERAIYFITDILPGHIFERFKQIVAAGGDVQAAAAVLHDKVDELVERLVS